MTTILKLYWLIQGGVGAVALVRARALYRSLRKLRDDYDAGIGQGHQTLGDDGDAALVAEIKAATATKIPETRYQYALDDERQRCLWSDCSEPADGFYCPGNRPLMNPWAAKR